MLVKKKDWEMMKLAISGLQAHCQALDSKCNVLQGLMHDQELRLDAQDIKKSEPTVSPLVIDEDGMYNFQQYKQKRKAKLSGEGDE